MTISPTRKVRVQADTNFKEETKHAKGLGAQLDELNKKSNNRKTRTAQQALEASRAGTFRTGGKGDTRDFSEQVQGLGGLVRAYAAVSANLFALTAAYGLLSKAADTAILERSADFLSSRYGVALKSTAKDIKALTDNALTMKDSLAFANLGSAAGLTTTQIAGLASAGKGAAQALGRDLEDSMNRIFKGAIKLEPELLDELGIMVKLTEATENYARANNKTVLALTQTEKMQAFVNAVTEEAERKYGELGKEQANPYSILLGVTKDLLDSSLQLVNKGLSPVVELMSREPTALASAVLLIGARLAKLALPDVLPQLEERLDTVKGSLKEVTGSLKDVNKNLKISSQSDAYLGIATSEAETKTVKGAKELATKYREALLNELEAEDASGDLTAFVPSIDTQKLEKEYEEALNKVVTTAKTQLGGKSITDATKLGWQNELKAAEAELKLLNEARAAGITLTTTQAEAQRLVTAQKELQITQIREQGALSVIQLQRDGKHLSAAISAYKTEQAITAELIKQNNLGGARAFALARVANLRGAAQFTKSVGISVLENFGKIGLAIGLATAAWAGFETVLSKVFKVSVDGNKTLAAAIQPLTDQIESLTRAKEDLAKGKSINDLFDIKMGTLRQLEQLTQTVEQAYIAFENFETNKGIFDRFKELFLNTGSKMATELVSGFVAVSDEAQIEKSAKNFVDRFDKALVKNKATNNRTAFEMDVQTIASANAQRAIAAGRPEEAMKAIVSAFSQFSPEVRQSMLPALKELYLIAIGTGRELGSVAAAMNDVKTATGELGKISKEYTNGLIKQTEQTKIFSQLVTGLGGMLESGNEGLAEFAKSFSIELSAISDTDADTKIALFNKQLRDFEKEQIKAGKAGEELATSLGEYRDSLLKQSGMFEAVAFSSRSMMDRLFELSRTSISVANNIAQLSRTLANLSAYESSFGKSTSTVEKRLELEQQIANQEQKALQDRVSILQKIARDRAKSLAAASGLDSAENLESIVSKARTELDNTLREIAGLQDKPDRKTERDGLVERAQISLSLLGQANEVQLALATAQSELNVALLKTRSAFAKALELEATKREEALTQTQKQARLAKETLELERSRVEVQSNFLPELTSLNSLNLVDLKLSSDLLENESKRNELIAEQKKLEADLKATRAADGVGFSSDQQARRAEKINKELANIQVNLKNLEENDAVLRLATELEKVTRRASAASAQFSTLNDNLIAQKALVESRADNLLTPAVQRLSLEKQLLSLTEQQAKASLASIEVELYSLRERIRLAREEAKITLNSSEEQSLILQRSTLLLKQEQILVDLANQRLEAESRIRNFRMKTAEASVIPDFKQYSSDLEQDFRFQVAKMRAEAESVGVTLNKGLVSAFDNSADRFAEMMKEGNLSFRELGTTIRNELANAYSEAAAAQLKSLWRDLIPDPEDTAAKVAAAKADSLAEERLNKQLNSQSLLISALDNLRTTISGTGNTTTTLKPPLAGSSGAEVIVAPVRVPGEPDKTAEMNREASEGFLTAANSSSLVAGALLTFTGQWKQAAFMFLTQLATTMLSTGSSKGSLLGDLFGAITGSATLSANGNIMSSKGPLPLNKYSKGGIANSPQLAIFGEGRQNEAYVPLPDNRSIPVTLSGSSGGVVMGDTNVNISIQSDGSMTAETSGELGKIIGSNIKRMVQEELLKQARPGGNLYRR